MPYKRSRADSPAFASLETLEPRALMTAPSWTFFGPGPLFSPTPAPPVSDPAANSVYADFDNDGITDIATAAGNTISFAKGLSGGSFEANRTTTLAGPVGFISAGRFDGSGIPSLIAVGTRGGAIFGNRPNPGFRLRAISFDPTAHADINGAVAGAFVFVTLLDVPDFRQHGAVPTTVVGDFFSGWRDEFALSLQTNTGENSIAVFEFKNRTTIIRKADVGIFLNPFNLAVGDVLGTGKDQILFAQTYFQGSHFAPDIYISTISAISLAQSDGHAGSITPIRSFPVPTLSFAVGDWDGDTRADIVALPQRGSSPENNYKSDSRLWLIRSLGGGDFTAPRALGERRIQDNWSISPDPYAPGAPGIAGLADMNGDGRLDILITSEAVWSYKFPFSVFLATVAIQNDGGNADIIRVPTTLDSHGGSGFHPPFAVRVFPSSSPFTPPIIIVGAGSLLRPDTNPQPPTISAFNASLVPTILGVPSPAMARFSARAFDADQLRGGSIARVEYYIDTNNDGMVDSMDIHVGDALAPDAYGTYSLLADVQANWGAAPTTIHVLARAVDDTGLFSPVGVVEMDLT